MIESMTRIITRLLPLAAILATAACNTFLGSSEDAPLPGDDAGLIWLPNLQVA